MLCQQAKPTSISLPNLVIHNDDLAQQLGLSTLSTNQKIGLYSGNALPESLKPIAMAYAGHQFGHYVSLLGDGRALLLGEIKDNHHKRWDIQLKGSGRTKFSRMGDGRAPLSSVLREYLVSEAMHGLGIKTTRSLAVVASKDSIYREEGMVPLGVLTRVAEGFLRVGSFEYARDQGTALVQQLANYAIARHYPHLIEEENPYLEFFKAVVNTQAHLIADWLSVGFIHGVMNTDNMSITGETIDYGPCAFMDEFSEHCVFSAIDVMGRYAFNNQVYVAHWNLAKLADALSSLFTTKKDKDALEEALNAFALQFNQEWNKTIRNKLGLLSNDEKSAQLIGTFIDLLKQHKPDFTNTFRQLAVAIDSKSEQEALLKMLGASVRAQEWIAQWLRYIDSQNTDTQSIMRSVNPAYIPRNHLIEKAIRYYLDDQDATLMDSLLKVFKAPYQQHANTSLLQMPPLEHERVYHTFCGT